MDGAWFCPLDDGSELDEGLAVSLPDFTAALESLSVLSSSELLKEENNNEKSFPWLLSWSSAPVARRGVVAGRV